MRAIAGYGVTGWTLKEAAPAENDTFKEWMANEIHAAAEQDVPVLIGMDVNAIQSAEYDCIGSSASLGPGASLRRSSVLAAAAPSGSSSLPYRLAPDCAPQARHC